MFAEGAEWSAGASSTIRCQSCGNEPAAVHVVGMEGGSVTHTHLCQSCAQELTERRESANAMVFAVPPGLSALLAGLLGKASSGGEDVSVGENLVCSECGASTSDLVETGLFGCHACYTVFSDYVSHLYEQAELGEHVGKIPSKAHEDNLTRREVRRLRLMLRELVEHERFEEAAGVRDRLVELGEQPSTG